MDHPIIDNPAREPLVRQLQAAEERAERAEAKLAAIGRLSPTDYDDREQLMGALLKILRGEGLANQSPRNNALTN